MRILILLGLICFAAYVTAQDDESGFFYGRGVGRIPDITPCPDDLRDDGVSCWRDDHIIGKGCCCTLWGCCDNCDPGYTDDGCTCRKDDTGIILTLFDRQTCKDDEDLCIALCFPKCKEGYSTDESSCNICTIVA